MNGCIIQARMGSTRLPGKVMMRVDTNPILYYVLKQTQQSKLIHSIVVATTNLEEDNVIEDYVTDFGVKCFRGDKSDVLDRYYQCAKKFSFSTITRITSDCPLIDPQIVDDVIKKFNSGEFDYVTNTLPRTFPYGTEVEVFSFNALEKAWKNAKKPSEREHVTPFLRNDSEFRIANIQHDKDISHLRWTVDRIEDFNLVKEIIARVKKTPILLRDILELVEKEPQLFQMNKDLIPNEGYLKSLKEDEEFMKKTSS
jgi:spore coat polysaccharide biosynthesis protein SpsF